MDKAFIKKKENQVFHSVIDDFISKKESNLKIIQKSNIDDILKNMFFQNPVNDIQQKFLFQASTLFFPFVKKVVSLLQLPGVNRLSIIMQKMIDEVLIIGSRIYDQNLKIYFKKIINFFAQKCIDFNEFIQKYPIINDNHFMKEYFIACFLPIMLYPIGQVKDFALIEKIIKIWIVTDNLCDWKKNNESKNLLLNAGEFLLKKKYINSSFEGRDYNPILQCLYEINTLEISFDTKINVFHKLAKLFKLCYSGYGIKNNNRCFNEKKLLRYTCLKSRKSLDIFALALDLSDYHSKILKREIFDYDFFYKYYSISLNIQLLDDLFDIRKDIQDNCISVFTYNENKNNALAYCLTINDIFVQLGCEVEHYFKVLQMLFMSYNACYLTDGVDEFLKNNIGFINLNVYNMDNILELMEDKEFMINCYKAYIHNNKIDFSDVKIENLLEELENQIYEN